MIRYFMRNITITGSRSIYDNTWKITIENSIVFDLLKEKSKKIT